MMHTIKQDIYCTNPKLCSVIKDDNTNFERDRVRVISLREKLESAECKEN